MAKNIPIFEVVEMTSAASRPLHTRGSTDGLSLRAVEQGVDQLTESMTNFIDGIQTILAKGAKLAGEFQMETVEVQASIDVEGKIGFLGTGAAAKGGSQLKIVFQRRKAD